jgi:hypothetical protein
MYHLVKFYTDEIPIDFYAPGLRDKVDDDRRGYDGTTVNAEFQAKSFGDSKLPLYVVLEPREDGKVQIVGQYAEGKINDEKGFAEFLDQPLQSVNK